MAQFRGGLQLEQRNERLSNFDYDLLLPETALRWLEQTLENIGITGYIVPVILGEMAKVLERYPSGIRPEQFFAELSPLLDPWRVGSHENEYDLYERQQLHDAVPDIAKEFGVESLEDYDESLRDNLDPKMDPEGMAEDQAQYYLQLAQDIANLPPEAQRAVIEALSPAEQQILTQLFGANPIGIAALDPSARAFLGLPTDDETLWAELEGLLQGSSLGQQLQTAYQLLEGWNYENSIAELEGFLAMKETLPTELLGVPLTEMGDAVQTFHDDMLAYHETMLSLRNEVFEAEGKDRQKALNWLRQVNPELFENSWKNMVLPDLIAVLQEQLNQGAFSAEVQHGYYGREDFVHSFIYNYSHGDPLERPEFKFAVGAGLFIGSVLFEPLDWVVTGADVIRDLSRGNVGIAGFNLATLFLPGAFSQLDDLGDTSKIIGRPSNYVIRNTAENDILGVREIQHIRGQARGTSDLWKLNMNLYIPNEFVESTSRRPVLMHFGPDKNQARFVELWADDDTLHFVFQPEMMPDQIIREQAANRTIILPNYAASDLIVPRQAGGIIQFFPYPPVLDKTLDGIMHHLGDNGIAYIATEQRGVIERLIEDYPALQIVESRQVSGESWVKGNMLGIDMLSSPAYSSETGYIYEFIIIRSD